MSLLPALFFVMATCFVAPHLTEREAKVFALIALCAGLIFWSVE